jgi:hypothetical protein
MADEIVFEDPPVGLMFSDVRVYVENALTRGFDGHYLYIVSRGQHSSDVLLSNGEWYTVHGEGGVEPPRALGLFLPGAVWPAIVEYASPGPSRAEISRLEEALAVERGRVDRILADVGDGTK